MKTTEKNIARGWWQRYHWTALREDGWTRNPVRSLRGRAADYSWHYQQSWIATIRRAEAAGYRIAYGRAPDARYNVYTITGRPS